MKETGRGEQRVRIRAMMESSAGAFSVKEYVLTLNLILGNNPIGFQKLLKNFQEGNNPAERFVNQLKDMSVGTYKKKKL